MTIYEVRYKIPMDNIDEPLDAYLLQEEANKHKDHMDNKCDFANKVNCEVYVRPIVVRSKFEKNEV